MNKASPAMANIIIHGVTLNTERQPFDCKLLVGGLAILSNIAQAPGFHRHFLLKGLVEWVCNIMHKIVSHKTTLTLQNLFFATKGLRMSAVNLNIAIAHSGHPYVSQVLNYMILLSMLKSAPFPKGELALLAGYGQLF